MAKFRSWNELSEKFNYWKDGQYYEDCNCTHINCAVHLLRYHFNWQNSEQSTVIHAIKDIKCYENDRLELEVACDAFIDPFGSVLVKGLLKKDEKGFYFDEDDDDGMGKTRLCHMTIIDGKVIGNNHQ